MQIGGTEVASIDVVWLADELISAGFDDIAPRLLGADSAGADVVRLCVGDVEALIHVLDDPPQRLAGLRAALIASTA